MTKVFYDHLVVIEDIEVEISKHEIETTARAEIMAIVDETLHHHVLTVIFDHLPKEHHERFLTRFAKAPHDETLLSFLKEHTATDMEKVIRDYARKIKREILQEIVNHTKP